MMAGVLATFAQYERDIIGERVRATHQIQRRNGKRMGRKRQTPDALIERIVGEREQGSTLQAIADGLNAEGVRTVRGGERWWPATVAAVLKSASYEAELAAARGS